MVRWFVFIFLGLSVFSVLLPWLEKLGIGRIPGDIKLTILGKRFLLPFSSTALIVVIFIVLVKLFK